MMISVFVIGLIAIVGFFVTKTKGFGRYATSTLLMLLVLLISSLLYSAGKLSDQTMGNILFAVTGFAGGLFTSKGEDSKLDSNNAGTSGTN